MQIYEGEGVPLLAEPECSVMQVELWTGKILTLDGRRRDVRSAAPYILTFDNQEEAERYAQEKVVESPDVECHIFNYSKQHVKRIIKEGHTRTINKPESRWWKFWR